MNCKACKEFKYDSSQSGCMAVYREHTMTMLNEVWKAIQFHRLKRRRKYELWAKLLSTVKP